MLAQLRSSLTYANVIATLALFVALGGTSYAVATGSIDSREIKNNAVGSKDLRNNDVRGKDIRNATIGSRDVKDGALLAADFMRGQLPAGATGPTGPQGPKGDPGATNVVIRKSATTQIAPGSNTNVVANCNPGEVAVGGGLNLFPAENVADAVVWGTVPEDLNPADGIPEGWRGRGRNEDFNDNDTGDVGAQAVVVCASP